MVTVLLWIISKLSESSKKTIALAIIKDIDIDNYTADTISTHVSKSSHNKITAYIVRD